MYRHRRRTATATSRERAKKIAVLERKWELPVKLREAIEEAKDDEPEIFLLKIENIILELLFGNAYRHTIDESKALNSDRDTEKEVETAIRFFPNVLSVKRYGGYPIHWQLDNHFRDMNWKSFSFIPLLARLGIELGQFDEEERGGLIQIEAEYQPVWNVLKALAIFRVRKKWDDEEHRQLVDETCLTMMKQLRERGLFVKEDIQEYDMIVNPCYLRFVPEQRLRYLAEWDPESLFEMTRHGFLPTHNDIEYFKEIREFRTVSEVRIHYFPMEMGGVFHKRNRYGSCETVYQVACKKFGNEKVKKIIEDAIDKIQFDNDLDAINALIYAANEDKFHLDGLYTLLRREPSVLLYHRQQLPP